MKSYKEFIKESKNFIESICKKYGIENYTINEDGTLDVDGNIHLSNERLIELPLRFRNIGGNFYCHSNQLISLEGCPEIIDGVFDCDNNQLISLEGCPEIIGGSFYCQYNNIVDFKGISEFFEGYFSCYDNPINEIYSLFRNVKCIKWINEFDVIQGNKVVMDRLEEVYHQLTLVVKKQTMKQKLLPFVFVSNLSNRLKKWSNIMFQSVLKVTHNGSDAIRMRGNRCTPCQPCTNDE